MHFDPLRGPLAEMDDDTTTVLRTGKQYSVGKARVVSYHPTQADAKEARQIERLDRRSGIYVWDARPQTDGSGIIISNPVRVA